MGTTPEAQISYYRNLLYFRAKIFHDKNFPVKIFSYDLREWLLYKSSSTLYKNFHARNFHTSVCIWKLFYNEKKEQIMV